MTSQHRSWGGVYQCPLCQLPLAQQANQYSCAKGHSFDCAKEGYVNLLPVAKKRSKDPGDSREMIQGRRAFLDAGYYEKLSDRINELALTHAPGAGQALDLGCGEGYYSHRLFRAMNAAAPMTLDGLDISRAAVRYGAKRYPDLAFCVASAYDMPFRDASFDLLLRVYAPSRDAELLRVMRPGACLITVQPGPMHHFAIKQLIYAEPRLHSEDDSVAEGFELIHAERLQWQLMLDRSDMTEAFLAMTPYAWKLSQEQKAELCRTGLGCELDFSIRVLRKR
ncbi:23S rRNA (guanine(745)-N(1))-methyltransferase [Shewanella cyperi]|uniref:23S rRNA (Guanine(745)-N(1))-methyltransferase n=1 Tax=Shewanella cyperi TaxID=2814292 RepID=A0A974XN60_9GAMM|nr:23S rRNA (guanine(745)-N(1))-methyltransferase [Shewanella cyperi]QSX31492.1 23S rRNA (guanine(745)-N(1))-methyltransferase [Shewanella cyperi]QSX42272.1 23S rRNA (guanine(745)-N(1))-methyltransferase [Shewanella cyperi]